MDQFNNIFEIVMFFAGLCALVYSLVSIVRTTALIRCSVEVTGEVIRLVRSHRKGLIVYAPVFTFSAADGRTCTVTSNVPTYYPYPMEFSVGMSVKVRYDPANPKNARIRTFYQTWGVAINSGPLGVVLLVIYYPKFLELLHLMK